MVQSLRGLDFSHDNAIQLFEKMGLVSRRDDVLSDYSSGMLQRVRYICALIHQPAFLFLDEPTTNLDRSGIEAVQQLVAAGSIDRVTIIATNESGDLSMCNKRLELSL